MNAYEKVKLLGQGSFGKVFLMRHKPDRALVCMKTIKVRNIPKKEAEVPAIPNPAHSSV
jgi:serine/threonine protein kinase